MSASAGSPFPPKAYDPGGCPRCGRPLSRGCDHMVKTTRVGRSSESETARRASGGGD